MVKNGDKVRYVWGMPGPDYDDGVVFDVRGEVFDIAFGEEAFGGAHVVYDVRLSEPGSRVDCGHCMKI